MVILIENLICWRLDALYQSEQSCQLARSLVHRICSYYIVVSVEVWKQLRYTGNGTSGSQRARTQHGATLLTFYVLWISRFVIRSEPSATNRAATFDGSESRSATIAASTLTFH